MAVDATLLLKEVDKVIREGSGDSNRVLTIKIKAGDIWVDPIRIESLRTVRSYASSQWADIKMMEVKVTGGVYAFDLLKNRDNIIVDVTYVELSPGTSNPVPDKPSITRRYNVVIQNINDITLTNKNAAMSSREAIDLATPFVDVNMQLIEASAYGALMLQGGDTYRNMTGMDSLHAECLKLQSAMSKKDTDRILRIEIADGYNTTVRKNVVIPPQTPLKNIPFWIHEKEGGLYPAGVGRYLQNQVFYIYPLYDVDRSKKNQLTLTIINVPNDRYQGGEYTYRLEGNNLTIICTGTAKLNDASLIDKLNSGNGVRFTQAKNLVRGIDLVKDGKMLIDRASNVYEVAVDKLQGNNTNFRQAKQAITDNPYLEYSELARKQGQQLDIQWTHGDIDLLYPGMPVKYMTVDRDTVSSYLGVLSGAEELRAPANPGIKNSRYPAKAQLAVFITRKIEDPNAPPVS